MTLKDYKVNFPCKRKKQPVITWMLKKIFWEANQAFMTEISENFEGTPRRNTQEPRQSC